MVKPLVRPARELFSVSWSEWDSLSMVKRAIRQLEMGIFHHAAEVVDAMGRDDRIRGVTEKRFKGLLRRRLFMEPQGDGRRADAVAEEIGRDFAKMYPEDALAELGHWGHMLNLGIAEQVWDKGSGRKWLPRLKVWHPKHVVWQQDRELYVLNTREGPRDITPGDGQWILFTPYGADRAWMRGLVRALYVPWLARQWAWRDAANHSEVWGSPQRKARVPSGASKEDQQKFFRAVAAIGASSTLFMPAYQSAAGEKFDVELLEALSTGAPFINILDKSEACIAICVLGNNLSTEVKGGSYAATVSHGDTEESLLASDGEVLSTCLHDQGTTTVAAINYGDAELGPYPRWDTSKVEDKKTQGEALEALGKGIAALQAVGAKPNVDEILEDASIPTSGKAGPPPPKTPTTPMPGGEGGNPQRPEDLPQPTQRGAQAARTVVGRGEVAGQLFVDELADSATAELAKLHGPDVEQLVALIRSGKSFDDIRRALAPFLKRMDASRKSALIEKVLILAELNGAHAVLESL